MKRTAFSNARGFSTLQLVITVAVMSIVAGFAVVGITRARDHVRLMNSARQFAAYVERARGDSVRRHASVANAATVSVTDNDTYAVNMDWDGFGAVSTRNFDLEQGVRFTTVKSITFDWRGRIANEESFGFDNGRDQVNVHITGSGDVTFDTERFYDALIPSSPGTGTGGGVTPEPGASPLPPPPPGTPTPTPDPNATPTPTPDPNATPTPTPDPNATPTPTPDPNATPTPGVTPSPQPCVLNAPDSLTIVSDGSSTVSVNRTNITGTGTISATSSNSGQIQVAPASRTVSGTAAGSFTITVKKNSGSVTFSSSGCTSKTVNITVP
ncbi:MAG TPA: hypothetical protein VIT19_02710 [Pyrinomonadaceae bacterium]